MQGMSRGAPVPPVARPPNRQRPAGLVSHCPWSPPACRSPCTLPSSLALQGTNVLAGRGCTLGISQGGVKQDCQHFLATWIPISGSIGAMDPNLAGGRKGEWIALLTPAFASEALNCSTQQHLVSKSWYSYCQHTPKNGAIF